MKQRVKFQSHLRGREILLGVGRGQELAVAVGTERVRGLGEDGGTGGVHHGDAQVLGLDAETLDSHGEVGDEGRPLGLGDVRSGRDGLLLGHQVLQREACLILILI